MTLPFAKYQALGNDFIVIDARSRPELVDDAGLAVRLLDRHRSIGGDDLIFLTASSVADCGMRIRTPSGGWLSMCGNGIRCLGRYARDAGLWTGDRLEVESAVGVRELRWLGGAGELISVDLLQPDLRAATIPTTLASADERVVDRDLTPVPRSTRNIPSPQRRGAGSAEQITPAGPQLQGGSPAPSASGGRAAAAEAASTGRLPSPLRRGAGGEVAAVRVTCVSVGNPHAVLFVEDLGSVPMERLGPAIEHHPAFPEGVNVHAAQVLAPDRARIVTWERGAGLTLA